MAGAITFYSDAALTQALSTGGTLTNPGSLGTVSIPAMGSTNGSSTQIYWKNTGGTTCQNLYVQPVTAPNTAQTAGHADGSGEVQVSADNATWGTVGAQVEVFTGTIAANATGSFYARAVVPSTDSPGGTAANCPVLSFSYSFTDLG